MKAKDVLKLTGITRTHLSRLVKQGKISVTKQAKQVVWITGLLILPFQGKIKEYAINTRGWNSGSD